MAIKSRPRKLIITLLVLVILGFSLPIVLFYGQKNSAKLSETISSVRLIAAKQGYTVVWNSSSPDTVIIDVTSDRLKGFGRAGLSDLDWKYYWAFYSARRAAGYSVIDSSECTVELEIEGRIIARRRQFLECIADH